MLRSILALFVLALLVAVGATGQTIVGSPHDLSTGGQITDKSTNESQVCVFCHTPHQKTVTAVPLWNHQMSSVASYGVYTSSTLNATMEQVGGGTGTTNLCMSCHDGTVGVNNLGNKTTVGTPTMGSGHQLDASGRLISDANLGTSLADDHPVNFTYDAALATADHGLKTPTSANFVDTGSEIPLFGAKVQCASCHNAHNNQHGAFTRVSNAGSALCLKCHTK